MFERTAATLAWLGLALIAFVTISPIGMRPHIGPGGLEHFVAFAAAGLLFGLAYPRQTALVCLLVTGSAIFLELLQTITADRHGRLIDAGIKILGAWVGIATSKLAPRLYSGRQ